MIIDVQALYDALAKIIEQRENVKVKIIVERDMEYEKDNRS